MGLREHIVARRAERIARRAARERRLRLERELAAYDTPAARDDLLAMLDRYPDGVTWELREILGRPGRTRARLR
jgi:hypothetical protein